MHLALDLQHWYNVNNMQWKKNQQTINEGFVLRLYDINAF